MARPDLTAEVRRVRARLLGTTAVALTAIVLAGCSSASDVATVNGVAITQDEVTAMRAAPAEAATTPADPVRQDLTTLILEQAVASAAEEQFGAGFTDADVEARLVDPPERYTALFETMSTDPNAGPRLRRLNARFTLVRDAVIPELLLAERGSYEAVIEETPEQVLQACVKHILVATEEEAQDVIDRLEDGEDFATLAAEVSLDQQSPGGLITPEGQCAHVGQLGGEFVAGVIDAPIGEPSDPISTSSGFHVVQVDERSFPTAREMAADPMAYLDPQVGADLLSDWFAAAVDSAEVDVRSSIGDWSAETRSVVAPS